MGHSRYGEGQIIARFSAEVKKPQKRAERSDQRLCRRDTTLAGALQDKVSHGLGVPLADFVTERLEQIRSAASVLSESRFLHPAMRLIPVAKGSHKSWLRS